MATNYYMTDNGWVAFDRSNDTFKWGNAPYTSTVTATSSPTVKPASSYKYEGKTAQEWNAVAESYSKLYFNEVDQAGNCRTELRHAQNDFLIEGHPYVSYGFGLIGLLAVTCAVCFTVIHIGTKIHGFFSRVNRAIDACIKNDKKGKK